MYVHVCTVTHVRIVPNIFVFFTIRVSFLRRFNSGRRKKKVPPFDPYNWRPFKKPGCRTVVER